MLLQFLSHIAVLINDFSKFYFVSGNLCTLTRAFNFAYIIMFATLKLDMNKYKFLYIRQKKAIILLLLFFLAFKTFAQKEDSLAYLSNDDEYNLVMASLRGDYNLVYDFLEKGIDVNIVLEESINPLINAARGGNTRIANLLLNKGADININPREGHTPLIAAVRYKQMRMTEFLLNKGAKINLANDLGRTPLIYAAANADSAMVATLLSRGANVQHRDTTGSDALMAAVSKGNIEISEMLLMAGARADSADNMGVTPLMLAAANLDYNMLNLLLAFNAEINAISKHKHTALTLALMQNDEPFVLYMIEQGADINQKLTFAETPLTVAQYLRTDIFIIDDLKDKGAKENILPDFRKVFVSPLVSFNNNDFMPGLAVGIRDYKYELDLSVGFSIRPYASRIIDKMPSGDYYQFWERRYSFFTALDKHFLLKINKYQHRQGIMGGLKVHYTKSNYRGVDYSTDDQIIIAPEIGYYYTSKLFSTGLNYSYCDFGKEGVLAHKMEFYIKALIGKAFIFNKEEYKIWE